MTTNNLTLIFTPAIFQDLNHAQNSPGEWHKDSVLEDLIMNNQDIFANKDLHKNSAITGHIQYGFDHTGHSSGDHHHAANRYAMTVQSPDSPTGTSHDVGGDEDEYSFVDDDDEVGDYVVKSIHDDESSNSNSNSVHLTIERQASITPVRVSSRPTTPTPPPITDSPPPLPPVYQPQTQLPPTEAEDSPSRQNSVERRKYQAHFQGKGLTVDTGSSMSSNGSGRDNTRDLHIPTIKSATVPSYDWLKHDPENSNSPPVPAVPKLRRSATTGKKVISRRKMSLHSTNQDEIPAVPPILNRGGNHSTSTTTIP